MDEADKKRLAELNAQADKAADTLAGKAISSPYTPWIAAVFLVASFLLGRWSV